MNNREYQLTSERPFTIEGKQYISITLQFKKCIHPKGEKPKSYQEVGGFICIERGVYESGVVTIYKTRSGYAASMYKDGCFHPYYSKCVLNEAPTNESLLLMKIQEYLHQSTAYLSTSTDYARGYKAGVEIVKESIANILRECGIYESYPN